MNPGGSPAHVRGATYALGRCPKRARSAGGSHRPSIWDSLGSIDVRPAKCDGTRRISGPGAAGPGRRDRFGGATWQDRVAGMSALDSHQIGSGARRVKQRPSSRPNRLVARGQLVDQPRTMDRARRDRKRDAVRVPAVALFSRATPGHGTDPTTFPRSAMADAERPLSRWTSHAGAPQARSRVGHLEADTGDPTSREALCPQARRSQDGLSHDR